ncbi:MAG: hypothetical protein IMZ71_04155 [Chloroflexi bacterium]|nr:hypothetical protein [Chloroflexota bacterium]
MTAVSDHIITSNTYLRDILAKLGGGAANGAVLTKPRLIMTHGTPTRPEYILPAPDLAALVAKGGPVASSGSSNTIVLSPTFNVNAIDRAGVESFIRNDAKPILQGMLDHYDLTVRTGGVRG